MSEETDSVGLFSGILGIARRDLLLAWKRPGDILNPLFFFAMVAALFPLAIGPSPEQLRFSGPAVMWVAALLSMLLSLNSLFFPTTRTAAWTRCWSVQCPCRRWP